MGDEVLTLEEISCLVCDQITSEILRRIYQTGDDCSPQISSLEKVEDGRATAHLSFDLNGSLHHSKGLLRMFCVRATEALDGAKSLGFAPATNQPPRRFGGEEKKDQQRGL